MKRTLLFLLNLILLSSAFTVSAQEQIWYEYRFSEHFIIAGPEEYSVWIRDNFLNDDESLSALTEMLGGDPLDLYRPETEIIMYKHDKQAIIMVSVVDWEGEDFEKWVVEDSAIDQKYWIFSLDRAISTLMIGSNYTLLSATRFSELGQVVILVAQSPIMEFMDDAFIVSDSIKYEPIFQPSIEIPA